MVRFVGKSKNLACHLETQGDYILSPLPNLLAPQDKLNLFQYSDPASDIHIACRSTLVSRDRKQQGSIITWLIAREKIDNWMAVTICHDKWRPVVFLSDNEDLTRL